MNSSLRSASRVEHVKIVAVALAAAIVFVLAGMNARDTEATSGVTAAKSSAPILRAERTPAVAASTGYGVVSR